MNKFQEKKDLQRAILKTLLKLILKAKINVFLGAAADGSIVSFWRCHDDGGCCDMVGRLGRKTADSPNFGRKFRKFRKWQKTKPFRRCGFCHFWESEKKNESEKDETYGAGSRTVLLRSNFEMLLVRFSGFDLNDRFEKKFCG